MRPAILLFLLLYFSGTCLVAQTPEPPTPRGRNARPIIDNLKEQIEQALDEPSEQQTDSLLTVARQAGFPAGEALLLCQLSVLRRDEDDAPDDNLLEQAIDVTSRIQDMGDAGWLMKGIGRLQKKFPWKISKNLAPAFSASGDQMSAIGRKMSKKSTRIPLVDEIVEKTQRKIEEKRRAWEGSPDEEAEESDASQYAEMAKDAEALEKLARVKSSISLGRVGALPSQIKAEVGISDKWLDNTIRAGTKSQPTIQRLTTKRQLRDVTQELSTTFAKQGDYLKAYEYYRQYVSYKDSLASEITSRKLASLTYKQSMQQKESQIQLLKKDRLLEAEASQKQRLILSGLAGCVGLLLFSSVVLVRNNRQKHTANEQLNEQKEELQKALADLKMAQSQLIQSEKMASLGELMAGIAHEIQNPLNFVNNFSELSIELIDELQEEFGKTPTDQELTASLIHDLGQNQQKINQHGRRADAIIKSMLAHSRTSTGEKQPTDLNALTSEFLRLSYHSVKVKHKELQVELVTDFDERLGLVTVVPQEMGRVLLNLFNNAFDAVQDKKQQTPPHYYPQLRISTRKVANQVEIRVRDNGTGIPDAIQAKIFQPFFTTKPTGQGTGLGLSLSYDIITKVHGGEFRVESTPGEATEFTVLLPA